MGAIASDNRWTDVARHVLQLSTMSVGRSLIAAIGLMMFVCSAACAGESDDDNEASADALAGEAEGKALCGGVVAGQVKDARGGTTKTPLASAQLTLRLGAATATTVTNESGYYNLSIAGSCGVLGSLELMVPPQRGAGAGRGGGGVVKYDRVLVRKGSPTDYNLLLVEGSDGTPALEQL